MKKILIVLVVIVALLTSCESHHTVAYRNKPQYRQAPVPTVVYVQPRPHHYYVAPPRHRVRGYRR